MFLCVGFYLIRNKSEANDPASMQNMNTREFYHERLLHFLVGCALYVERVAEGLLVGAELVTVFESATVAGELFEVASAAAVFETDGFAPVAVAVDLADVVFVPAFAVDAVEVLFFAMPFVRSDIPAGVG